MELIIPIRPKPKGRPRFYKGHAVTPQETRDYETAIGMEASLLVDEPLKGAIFIDITFSFKVRSGSGWHTKKPDLDNLVKSVLDGLNGILWEDDKQVAEIRARKFYGSDDYVKILIQEM